MLLVWVAACAALLALLYRDVAVAFWPRWLTEAPYRHCVLVPFIVGALIWYQQRRLAQRQLVPSAWGLVLLAIGLSACWLGYATGARVLVGLSFPVVLLGLVTAACGKSYLKAWGFPLALFIFAVPIPRHIIGLVAMPMQLISSALTAACTHVLGIPVQHEGVNIAIPGFRFTVAEECSGMNSLLALFLAGGAILEITGLVTWQKLVVYALVPVVVIVANVARLMSVVVLGELAGGDFALNSLTHGTSDIVVYLAAFLLIWLLTNFLRGLTPALTTSAASEETPTTAA